MALERLFIRSKKQIGSDAITVSLDAFLSESHRNDMAITTNPVELRADISDHAIIQPKKLSIRAIVSDTPLRNIAQFSEVKSDVTNLFGSSTAENITRSHQAWEQMIALQESREVLKVETRLAEYNNMLITSLNTIQDKDSSRIVEMVIEMVEVRLVESTVVQLTDEQLAEGSAKSQAAPPNNDGRKNEETVKKEKAKSWYVSIFNPTPGGR